MKRSAGNISSKGDRTEVIIVGKDNYSKMNEFWPWRVDSGSTDTAANTFFFPYDSLERMIPEFNVRDSREESIDGKTALVVTLVLQNHIRRYPHLLPFGSVRTMAFL
jgi:hypothetical protein